MTKLPSASAKNLAPHTRRAYDTAWKLFVAWCREEGYRALPADADTVAAYLTDRANRGRSISTLKVVRAAILYYHKTQGAESPTSSPSVSTVLRDSAGRGRDSASVSGKGQATGLTAVHLDAIRATACLPRTSAKGRESEEVARRRGAIDIALISVMRDALLRRSEAARLLWPDVEFRRDGTALVTIRSQSDQESEDAVQFVGPDATAALKAIRPPVDDATDIATRSVFGLRLDRTIANRIKAAAKAADLEGNFSGHSPRLGMALDLAKAGMSIAEIAKAGRWTSIRMLAHYVREQATARGRCDVVARHYSRLSAR